MKTIKRNAPNIIPVERFHDYVKFQNQIEFKGIVQDDNIFAVDQHKLRDAKNVYMDEDMHFVSRLPLVEDSLPNYIKNLVDTKRLIDIVEFGKHKIYVLSYDNVYDINIDGSENTEYTISGVSNYNICYIDHYIIVFNNLGAKVFDVSTPIGFEPISNFVDVPIIKTVVGSKISQYEKNEFTKSYKELYVYSSLSQPVLPDGNADVKYYTNQGVMSYRLLNANKFTEYRLLRMINWYNNDYINLSVAYNEALGNSIIAVLEENGTIRLSYNGGETWNKLLCPISDINKIELTKNGEYVFAFGTIDNRLYYCNLDTLIWGYYTIDNTIDSSGYTFTKNCDICCFVNDQTFAFCDISNDCLYYHMPEDNEIRKTSPLGIVNSTYGINAEKTTFGDTMNMEIFVSKPKGIDQFIVQVAFAINYNSSNNYKSDIFNIICGKDTSSNFGNDKYIVYKKTYGSSIVAPVRARVNSCNVVFNYGVTEDNYNVDFILYQVGVDEYWHSYTMDKSTVTQLSEKYIASGYDGPCPILLNGAYLEELSISALNNYDSSNDYDLPTSFKLKDENKYIGSAVPPSSASIPESVRIRTIISGDNIFIATNNGRIYTTEMVRIDDTLINSPNTASITYTILANNDIYDKVPTVSYSGQQLYLGFNNLLQITENSYNPDEPTKIQLKLTNEHNELFIDNITGMTAISTTEVAIMFKNAIKVSSRSFDENLNRYIYSYYNTKLSLGMRNGDDIINTLEGTYTIFPTQRGLAALSYQAFMATTDQVISYISEDIKEVWTKFYNNSETIKLLQWRTMLVITNGTKQILLYDLTKGYWWIWEVPVNIDKMSTDQVELSLLSGRKYVFREAPFYYDFPNTYNEIKIEWFAMSQPLHFNMPTYYKNMKQLVFQFYNENDYTDNNSIVTQIKLYRKRLNIKEPDEISFKIEGFRTFVKRFNYWKINELQWAIANDSDTEMPSRLKLNCISIKYEVGDEVR